MMNGCRQPLRSVPEPSRSPWRSAVVCTALGLLLAACGSPETPAPAVASRFALVANLYGDDVSVYTIDAATGALAPVPGSPFAVPRRPCAVSVPPSGGVAYVASCGDETTPGGVMPFTIDATSGALKAVEGALVAAGERPRALAVHPSGNYLYVANQGTPDNPATKGDVRAFVIDRTTGTLSPVAGSPFAAGSRPASIAVHPSGRFAYVANSYSGDVSAYAIDSTTGALRPIAGSPVPAGSGPSSIAVHPSGAYAYVANGSDNTLAIFSIDNATGSLSPLPGSPLATQADLNCVAIHPSGAFALVAAWFDAKVLVYSIDRSTGALAAVPGSPFATAWRAESVAISSNGAYAYVASTARLGPGTVSAYAIGATGFLTPVPGSPFAAGEVPYSIALAP